MENAADALKIAFAMFVFALAITLTFTLVSQAKSTADTVLYYSDETNFYEHSKSDSSNREVSVAEIIPTLYRYYDKESIGVTVNLKSGKTYVFDLKNNETIIQEVGSTTEIKSLNSKAEREENLKRFIQNILIPSAEDSKFIEEFVEIPISGIYEYGSDGSELVISSRGKKVYITYTEK